MDVIKELPISGRDPLRRRRSRRAAASTPGCPFAKPECSEQAEPELADLGGGHYHACRRWKEIG
ncbi:MAG: hypothetical protein M0C28_22815 [Candidatus Moduliflexus flocculans]|nr:hypothetical protein [Candidatus Moduliflexus flocculans]